MVESSTGICVESITEMRQVFSGFDWSFCSLLGFVGLCFSRVLFDSRSWLLLESSEDAPSLICVVVVSCLGASRLQRVTSQVLARAGAQVGAGEGQEGQRKVARIGRCWSEQV